MAVDDFFGLGFGFGFAAFGFGCAAFAVAFPVRFAVVFARPFPAIAAILPGCPSPPLPVGHSRTTDAADMARRSVVKAVYVAILFTSGCLELDATGLPGTPASFGITNECYAVTTCAGVQMRWDMTTCAVAGEVAAETVAEACDEWAWANCPEAAGFALPCFAHCQPRVKTCPVYDGAGAVSFPPEE